MKALVLVLLALSGCYFKTKDTLVESPISAAQSTSTVVSEQPTQVLATTRANVLSIQVTTPRQCVMQTSQVFEVVEGKKVTIGVTPWILPVVVVPWAYAVVLPVTALVAFSRAKSENNERYTENRIVSRQTFACALPVADEVAHVRFPSGAAFDVRTDKRGVAAVFIPDDELDHGAARVELSTVERTVDYDRRAYDAEQLAIVVDE